MAAYGGDIRLRCEVGHFSISEVVYRPWLRVALHAHERPHIGLVQAGEMFESGLGEERVRGPEGSLIRPPGTPHENRFFAAETVGYIIEFPPHLWRWFSFVTPGANAARYATLREAAPLSAVLRNELHSSDVWRPVVVQSVVLQLAAAFARAAISDVQSSLEDATRVPTIDDLAATQHTSVQRLRRLYRQCTGEALDGAILRRRVSRARELLSTTRASIAEIATEAGFYDQAHLTRVFKRVTGMTPAVYRMERFGV